MPDSQEVVFDELPIITLATGGGPMPRRRFLGLVGLLVVVGYAFLSLYKGLPWAAAENPPYEESPNNDPYGTEDPSAACNANAGCFGSPYIGDGYCCTCDEYGADTALNRPYFMLNSWWPLIIRNNGMMYLDHEDICNGGYDAWRHFCAPTWFCNPAKGRCHDGYKWDSTYGTVFVIAHCLAKCNGAPLGVSTGQPPNQVCGCGGTC